MEKIYGQKEQKEALDRLIHGGKTSLKSETFEHDGKQYVVETTATENGIQVRAFLDGKPASNLTYSVSWETQNDFDAQSLTGTRAIDTLMSLAKGDICKKQIEQKGSGRKNVSG